MLLCRSVFAVLLVLFYSINAFSADGLSDGEKLAFGAAISLPVYFATVAGHEGAHALAGTAFDADIIDIEILPFKENGSRRFGRVVMEGDLSKDEEAVMLAAPKILNALMLSGYSYLLETDNLPQNEYGEIILTTLAAGQLVDFIKGVFDTREGSDMERLYELYNLSHEEELAARVAHGLVGAFFAYEVGKGILRIFYEEPDKASEPMYETDEADRDLFYFATPDSMEFGWVNKF